MLFLDGILCQDVMMLNFFPQLSESEFSNNHEFIIVIDRSGLCRHIFLLHDLLLIGMALMQLKQR